MRAAAIWEKSLCPSCRHHFITQGERYPLHEISCTGKNPGADSKRGRALSEV